MTESQIDALKKLAELTDKAAMELVFAEEGKDNGLLPINLFVSDMESLPLDDLPGEFIKAVAGMRKSVDKVFDGTGLFAADSLKTLGDLVNWLQTATKACPNGQTLPPLPDVSAGSPAAAKQDSGASAEAATEQGINLNLADDIDLLREFVNESQEHLANIENGVLVLEDNPSDKDTLASIFRAFHTFKGGSGFLNLVPINRLAHELESLLDLARQDKITITSEVIDLILTGGDTLKQFVTSIELQVLGQAPVSTINIPILKLLKWVGTVIASHSAGGSVHAAEAEHAADAAAVEAAKPRLEICEAPASVEKADNVVEMPKAAESKIAASKNGGSGSSVKVDTFKLDCLIDMVGELVIAQSMVGQDEDLKLAMSQKLARNMAQLGRVTRELQRTAMALRMVPVKATFQKMTRLVRDLSLKAGKQVELVLTGEDCELDRTIVEEISDPLVHMMRNSVDHGIEKPEARVAAGKSHFGTVHLSAYHQGGNFVIQIKDDGGGLPKAKILKKAVERGVIPADHQLSDKEIFNLIFAPGFSTADKITDISGRGVGMDVVKRNIEKLRGKIDIESVEGKGTTFSIYLPLTLAIIDGMIVRVGEDRYIIPTLSVRESFRPSQEMLSTLHERGEIVNVRGRLLPMLRLKQYFTNEPDLTDPTQAVLIVVESDRRERCLLVDELVGKQEIVIKSLGETFKGNPLLAGAAILGDGKVGLILDVDCMVRLKDTPLATAA